MRKLPEREGDVRIITIADFDRNACGGTHVRSTGQIGGLLVRGTEKVRQGVRVGFVCGLRAMRTARSDFELLTASGRALSLAAAEVPAAVARLQEQNKQAAKERAAFFQRMAAYQATEMLRQTGDGGHRFVCQTLAPPDAPDASYVKVLASKIASEDAQAVALLGWSPAPGAEIPASVFLACGGAADMDCAALLKQAMDAHRGRGGGTKTMAQGTIAPAALAAVLETLSSACH
jgi:alanyl-tRNA synthetase